MCLCQGANAATRMTCEACKVMWKGLWYCLRCREPPRQQDLSAHKDGGTGNNTADPSPSATRDSDKTITLGRTLGDQRLDPDYHPGYGTITAGMSNAQSVPTVPCSSRLPRPSDKLTRRSSNSSHTAGPAGTSSRSTTKNINFPYGEGQNTFELQALRKESSIRSKTAGKAPVPKSSSDYGPAS